MQVEGKDVKILLEVRRMKMLRTPGQDCSPLFRGNLMRQKISSFLIIGNFEIG